MQRDPGRFVVWCVGRAVYLSLTAEGQQLFMAVLGIAVPIRHRLPIKT